MTDERDIQLHEDGVASSDAKDQSDHRRELVEQVRTRIDQSAAREQGRLIHVVINPVAGKGQPVLKVLNAAMQVAGVAWEVFVTKAAGDCHNFVKQAVEAGVDQVIVYGGDGTIMEAASALMGTHIPLAIIPGGTGNVMSAELRIPVDLVDVIVVRSIDLPALASLLASVVGGMENPEKLAHWQAKQITLASDPVQKVQVDGEILCETPFTVRVVPQAVKMIVPSQAAGEQ